MAKSISRNLNLDGVKPHSNVALDSSVHSGSEKKSRKKSLFAAPKPSPEFEVAFKMVVNHEGGYVNDPLDPGGETKYGISKRSYPHVDIASLTVAKVKPIYFQDFWLKCQCHKLPHGLDYLVFSTAVNCGVGRAIRWLQLAVGAGPDGLWGPHSEKRLKIALTGDAEELVVQFIGYRLWHYMKLDDLDDTYGRGWGVRTLREIFEYTRMVK